LSEIKIFLLTKVIVQESEKNLLLPFNTTHKSIFQKYRLAAEYMILGFKELFRPFLEFVIILVSIIILSYIYNIFADTTLENIILIIITCISLIFFAIPSTYAFYGIENKDIEKVINILYKNNIKTISSLENIENNIDVIYSRTKERIKTIRWIVSISWLGFTLFQKQFIMMINKQSDLNINDFAMANIEITIQMLVYICVAIIMIASYKKGMDFLFNTIKFAINEYKIILKKDNLRISYYNKRFT